MRKLMSITAVAAVVLFAAVGAFAAPAVNVGGMPLIMTTTGTSASSAVDVTWTTTPGFSPDFIQCVDELDGEPNVYTFYKGMAATSAFKLTGSSGVVTYVSAGGSTCHFVVDAAAGTIVIDATCQTNSEGYACVAARYAQ